jgi:hypothetical protein
MLICAAHEKWRCTLVGQCLANQYGFSYINSAEGERPALGDFDLFRPLVSPGFTNSIFPTAAAG